MYQNSNKSRRVPTVEIQEEALNLLLKSDYIPLAIGSGNSCVLSLPPSTIFEGEAFEDEDILYELNYETNEVFIGGEAWKCPAYAQQMLVQADMLRRLKQRGINASLLQYHLEDPDSETAASSVLDILSSPANSPSGEDREAYFIGLVSEAIEAGFPQEFEKIAEREGLLNGYILVKSLLA